MRKTEHETIERADAAAGIGQAEAVARVEPPSGVARRTDYRPPTWRITEVVLDFALAAERTEVTALLRCTRQVAGAPLVLDCDFSAVTLLALTAWSADSVAVVEFELVPRAGAQPVGEVGRRERQVAVGGDLPADLWVHARARLVPAENSALSGLYQSASGLFTQCEPEGFRRIVPFIDRPDVLARYRVRLTAERARYPVLLANGNLVAYGEWPDGRHFAVWADPFPKPSYLFALVAADLAATEARVPLADGREALLQVWTAHEQRDRATWALESLKAALRWDEARFGRLLDLDRYMIVAVEDFNMGAMENKGLNLFNAKYVLVTPETATDADYANVESIVGHEYFHNWTGNRVTCRDWFQLTLKEGLTVFRDQEFSADQLAAAVGSPEAAAAARAVKRIDDVATLIAVQFPEDDGPMRHPIRPESYRAIDNFYTATVYEKGAEVVRLLHTLLGEEGFCRGIDHYFARFDGQAVTCEDFVAAIAEANGVDLSQFLHWYDAAGTPEVTVAWRWVGSGAEAAVELTLTQRLAGWDVEAKPLLIPVRLGWVGRRGALPFAVVETREGADASQEAAAEAEAKGEAAAGSEGAGNGDATAEEGLPPVVASSDTEAVLLLKRPTQRWRIAGLDPNDAPVPSLLRGFSAPVRLRWAETPDGREPLAELLCRFATDSDPFNRWQAGQALMEMALQAAAWETNKGWFAAWRAAWQAALEEERLDALYRVRLLSPPAEAAVRDGWPRPIDPVLVRARLMALWRTLAEGVPREVLEQLLARHTRFEPYRYTPQAAGSRALAGLLLKWLALRGDSPDFAEQLAQRWAAAHSLTERLAVVDAALCHADAALAEHYLAVFAARYDGEPLVLDKWFQRYATRWLWQGQSAEAVVERVAVLTHHPRFRWSNPNKVYALLLALFAHNLPVVLAAGARGWALWEEAVVRLDGSNPLVAARLARAVEQAPHWVEPHCSAALAAVAKVRVQVRSAEVQEVLGRIVGEGVR